MEILGSRRWRDGFSRLEKKKKEKKGSFSRHVRPRSRGARIERGSLSIRSKRPGEDLKSVSPSPWVVSNPSKILRSIERHEEERTFYSRVEKLAGAILLARVTKRPLELDLSVSFL